MKNQTTLKITTGAMMIAIFTLLLIINRQTGSLFEEMLLYIMPLPMVAYCVRFDWKAGLPVMVAMILMSFLFGTMTTIFYAACQCLIGLVFGSMLYHKADSTRTLFVVLVLSAIFNVLNTIVLASFFGYDLNRDILEMQQMMNGVFTQAGVALPDGMLNTNYLMRMMVISMILLGIVQGYIIYVLSLLILRRLNFHVEKPKSIYEYYPSKIVGILAVPCFLTYFFTAAYSFDNLTVGNLVQTAGICAYFYLLFFGYLYLLLYMKANGISSMFLRLLLAIGLTIFAGIFLVFLGILYVLTDHHQKLLEGAAKQDALARKKREGNGTWS